MWTWTDVKIKNDMKSKEDCEKNCRADNEVFFKEDEEDQLNM